MFFFTTFLILSLNYNWLYSFYSPSSEHAQALFDFHNYAMFYLGMVVLFVVWGLRFALNFTVADSSRQYDYYFPSLFVASLFKRPESITLALTELSIQLKYVIEANTFEELLAVRPLFFRAIILKDRVFSESLDSVAYNAVRVRPIDFFAVKHWKSFTTNTDTFVLANYPFTAMLYRAAHSVSTFVDFAVASGKNFAHYVKTYRFLFKSKYGAMYYLNIRFLTYLTFWARDLIYMENRLFFVEMFRSKSKFLQVWNTYNFYTSSAAFSSRKSVYTARGKKNYKLRYLFGATDLSKVWSRKKKGSSTRLVSKFNNFAIVKYLSGLNIFYEKTAIETLLRFQQFRHNTTLELIWTAIPSYILALILYPSMLLLYGYDRPYVTDPYLTFKAIGHQWYWSYEFGDDTIFGPVDNTVSDIIFKSFANSFNDNLSEKSHLLFANLINTNDYVVAAANGHFTRKILNHAFNNASMDFFSFDSYIIHEDDLPEGGLRLLETDTRVVLPTGICTRLVTTSTDVIHSWAVPALGSKMDSVPGRLNQQFMVLNRPGVYYGQCSEICGVGHGFMPIMVEVVSPYEFLHYVTNNYITAIKEKF